MFFENDNLNKYVMNYNSIQKINFSSKEVIIPTIAAGSSVILNRTLFKGINPTLKNGGSMALGTAIILLSKNKTAKHVGLALIIANGVSLGYDILSKSNSEIDFIFNRPSNNAVLINIYNGKLIQRNKFGEGIIYLTKKNDLSGWTSSSLLKHRLNISGRKGGQPSKKGDLVKWENLKNHSQDFDELLLYWIHFFEAKKMEFQDTITDFLAKNIYWRSMVNDGKKLDIKKTSWSPAIKGEWSKYYDTLLRYDDYGNILYGAAGTAFGLSQSDLLFGANVNQLKKTGLDDLKDSYSIKRGIEIYKSYIQHRQKLA
jgi:hypothetical protein